MMKTLVGLAASWSALSLIAGASAEIVYVTDLTIFTLLAPCAKSAVRYGVGDRTIRSCPAPVTELQSCICTKNDNRLAVSSFIASGVSYSCGETASEDQQSAQVVLSAYCDQVGADGADQPTPTQGFEEGEHPVEAYASDLQWFSDLAPCAQTGVSIALLNLCPTPASLLAPCLCGKNENSLAASQTINTSVNVRCNDNPADVSSAQAFFAAYCAMTDGTTSFPTPSSPPGDMTYSITALPEYSALAPCAKSAISSGLFKPKESYCPEGPQAFASCACLKEGVSKWATSTISVAAKRICDDVTDGGGISSALEVFGYYCSAARGELVATGVTESIGQANSSPTSGGDDSDDSDGKKSGPPIPTIVGSIVGSVGAIGAIAALVFYLRKRKRDQDRTAAAAAAAATAGAHPYTYGQPPAPTAPTAPGMAEKPELMSTQLAGVMPSPSPASTGGAALAAKDVGATPSPAPTPAPAPAPAPTMPELQGGRGTHAAELVGAQQASMGAELQGAQAPGNANMPPELLGGQAHTQAELPGGQAALPAELLGWQAHTQAELPGGQAHHVGAELQGQQYHPQELQGQQQYAQELHGQQQGYGYPAPQQGAYGQPGVMPQQPQTGYAAPGGQPAQASWQAGPVQGYYEMPTPFQQQPPGPQQ